MEKNPSSSGNKPQISNLRFYIPFFLLLVSLLSLGFTFSLPAKKKEAPPENIRKAAVAGTFYPRDKPALEKHVDELLRQANPPEIKEPIRAVMVPHAGYIFSGPVAAYAYKELEGRGFKTVVLISNSHTISTTCSSKCCITNCCILRISISCQSRCTNSYVK